MVEKMVQKRTFKAKTFLEFSRQLESIFFNGFGKLLFVECPVRMVKSYTAERFMARFLKEDQGAKNKIIIFCTEQNLLVDSSFLEINKELTPAGSQNLLVFKKETSKKSNDKLTYLLSQKHYKVVCLCSFAYMIGVRFSNLLRDSYNSNAQVSLIVDK